MYAKIFAQMFDGTLCTKGPWQALVTFQQMLILADLDGNVDMTPAAISRRTTIPLDIIQLGIAALLEPDPESRTPTEEGRRLLPLSEGRSWGWRIVNYAHYRQLQREQDRRAYHREYWHKRKDKGAEQPDLNVTQHTQPNQPIAYAEAKTYAETEAEAKETKTKRSRAAAGAAFVVPAWVPSEEWDAFVEHRKAIRGVPFTEAAKKGVIRELEKLTGQGHDAASLLQTAVTRGWRTVFPPAAQKATQCGSVSEAGMATYANGISLKTRIFGNESN
jgi:hypothetical protein